MSDEWKKGLLIGEEPSAEAAVADSHTPARTSPQRKRVFCMGRPFAFPGRHSMVTWYGSCSRKSSGEIAGSRTPRFRFRHPGRFLPRRETGRDVSRAPTP